MGKQYRKFSKILVYIFTSKLRGSKLVITKVFKFAFNNISRRCFLNSQNHTSILSFHFFSLFKMQIYLKIIDVAKISKTSLKRLRHFLSFHNNTHTHTHTHIYIYIYMYIYSTVGLMGPNKVYFSTLSALRLTHYLQGVAVLGSHWSKK